MDSESGIIYIVVPSFTLPTVCPLTSAGLSEPLFLSHRMRIMTPLCHILGGTSEKCQINLQRLVYNCDSMIIALLFHSIPCLNQT